MMLTTALHLACMNAVVKAIQALPLSDGTAMRVYELVWPNEMVVAYPCVFVTIINCTEELNPYSTELDEKVLPIAIHLMHRQAWKDPTLLPPLLAWREQLTSAFLMQTLYQQVPQNWHIDMSMMSVLDAQKTAGTGYQFAVSSFWIKPKCVTPRIRPLNSGS